MENHIPEENHEINIRLLIIVGIFGTLTLVIAMWTLFSPHMLVEKKEIDSYEDCVDAGYPILESYPEQCMTDEGESFTRELTEEEKKKLESAEDGAYYGQSTLSICKTSQECVVTGCNSEICQSSNEESIPSICVKPEQPTASELGYKCECVLNQCRWNK